MAQQNPEREEMRERPPRSSRVAVQLATAMLGDQPTAPLPKAVCCESSTSGSDTEDTVPDLLEGGLTSSSDSSYAANSDEANYSRKPDNSRKAREQRRERKRKSGASAVYLGSYGPTYNTAVEVTSRGSLAQLPLPLLRCITHYLCAYMAKSGLGSGR